MKSSAYYFVTHSLSEFESIIGSNKTQSVSKQFTRQRNNGSYTPSSQTTRHHYQKAPLEIQIPRSTTNSSTTLKTQQSAKRWINSARYPTQGQQLTPDLQKNRQCFSFKQTPDIFIESLISIDCEDEQQTKLNQLNENLIDSQARLDVINKCIVSPKKNKLQLYNQSRIQIAKLVNKLLQISKQQAPKEEKTKDRIDKTSSEKPKEAENNKQMEQQIEQLYHNLQHETSMKEKSKLQFEQMVLSQQNQIRQLKLKLFCLQMTET